MVREGNFRRDLLYRINTLSFYIPPLNQRKEDIEVIAQHFPNRCCKRYAKEIDGFSTAAMHCLMNYEYEGNIRELQGMVVGAGIICAYYLIKFRKQKAQAAVGILFERERSVII